MTVLKWIARNARSWAFVGEAVRELEDGMAEARAIAQCTAEELAVFPGFLREMAAEPLRVAHEIDGPIPSDVSEFVRRHRYPADGAS